ncbi:MAG: site-specific tyrosine recombinase XerD [Verrucomicrobiota bacterium]|nr:site-specific tyrosine recombinase XerD [Verrucomicrobiota bacterium]
MPKSQDIAPSLVELLEEFLGWMQLERGLSPHTLSNYENDLAQFAIYLESKGILQWSEVLPDHLSGWLKELNHEDYNNASTARKLSAVRGLSKYLTREKRIPKDFTSLIGRPKVRRPLPGTLSGDEISRLLAAPSEQTAGGLRDRAFLELMYASGLRVSELCGMTLQNVDLKEGFLMVRAGKGRKDRLVPFGKKARDAMERYIVQGRPSLVRKKTGSALFISNRGTAISRKTVWYLIQNYTKIAGINKKIKPHLLRHSFATHLLQGGADLRSIQEMLGHASITTTQIYTTIEEKKLIETHSKFHPRGK